MLRLSEVALTARMALVVLMFLSEASTAAAQPYAWVPVAEFRDFVTPLRNILRVVNLGTAHVQSVELPSGIVLGQGAIDPTTGHYFLITNMGTGEIQASPPRLLPGVKPWAGSALFLSPDGFHAYLDSPNEETRVKKLEAHAKGVKQHVMHLSSRDYTRHLPEGSFVVMYIPSEACLSAGLDSDRHLLEYAFEKNIILATPTIIFALLKTVATGWQQYLIDKYAKEILAHGQELYHRLQKFSEHLAGIGRGLKTAVDKFNEAVGSYESRLLPGARRFYELRGAAETLPEVKTMDIQPRQLQPPEPPDKPTSD